MKQISRVVAVAAVAFGALGGALTAVPAASAGAVRSPAFCPAGEPAAAAPAVLGPRCPTPRPVGPL